MTLRIDILVYDGFDELDAIAPFEVFQNAARVGADCTVSLVTLDDRETVTASHGLRIGVDGVLADPGSDDAPDLLVVPGGGWSDSEDRGVRREYDVGTMPKAIAAHREAGAKLASVCTGAMLLQKAGVLEGRSAVTHHSAMDDLRDTGVKVVDRRVVDTGAVATAGGVTSGIDLALYLVEREFGEATAKEVSGILEYDREDDVLVTRNR